MSELVLFVEYFRGLRGMEQAYRSLQLNYNNNTRFSIQENMLIYCLLERNLHHDLSMSASTVQLCYSWIHESCKTSIYHLVGLSLYRFHSHGLHEAIRTIHLFSWIQQTCDTSSTRLLFFFFYLKSFTFDVFSIKVLVFLV